MAKVINTYRGYSASDINGRASATCDHSVSGSNVDCTNVTTTRVDSVLGISTHQLSALCTSGSINKWSAFSPYYRTVSGSGQSGTIVHNLPSTNFKLGSFAGYNHSAVTPAYISSINDSITIASGGTVTIECQFTLGELIIEGGDIQGVSNIQGIVFTVWEGATLKGHQVRSLASLKNTCSAALSTSFIVSFTGPASGNVTYNCKLYFITSPTTYSYGVNEVCKLFSTELPQFTKQVHVQVSNTTSITGPYTATFGSGLTVNTANGRITSNGLTYNHTYSTRLVVTAWVEDWQGTRVTDIYTLRSAAAGAYTSGTNVLTQRSTGYGTAGSDTNPALSRMIWSSGGSALGLPMSSYDLIWRIDFAGV